MSTLPPSQDDSAERDADRQADAMKDRLRKDVASWSEARGEPSLRSAQQTDTPSARQPPPPSVAGAKKAKAARTATPVAAPAPVGTKPFKMSYDGGSTADYIQYMIKRGAR